MADLDFHIPEFTIALRGYDRFQVDSYIDRLQGLLEETEERLRSLEPGDHHQDVGPRISQIFDLAAAEAQDIRAGAEEESTRLLQAARTDAEAVVAAKRTEWEEMLAAFEGRREQIRQEVAELRGQKATVLEEVRRLHQALGAASGLTAPPAELGVGDSDGSEAQTQLLSPGRAWDGMRADGGFGDEAIDGEPADGEPADEESFVEETGDDVTFDEDPPTVREDRTQEFTTVELPKDLRRAG